MLDKSNSLAEWVLENNNSKYVFAKFGLDFCCSGGRSLEGACQEAQLNVQNVIDQIAKFHSPNNQENTNFKQLNLADLVDFILNRFHEKHREDLKVLIPLAQKVESVHSDHPLCPKGLSDFLQNLSVELENHMQKEEQILFPMIKNGQGQMMGGPVNVMMHEHVEHGENLKILNKLAHHFVLPEDACGSWNFLYKVLQHLDLDIREHISIENYLLFPKALN